MMESITLVITLVSLLVSNFITLALLDQTTGWFYKKEPGLWRDLLFWVLFIGFYAVEFLGAWRIAESGAFFGVPWYCEGFVVQGCMLALGLFFLGISYGLAEWKRHQNMKGVVFNNKALDK